MTCKRVTSSHKAKEPLNKSSSAAAESFTPAMQFKKQEMHTVFLCFLNFYLGQNFSASALADLIRAPLRIIMKHFKKISRGKQKTGAGLQLRLFWGGELQ